MESAAIQQVDPASKSAENYVRNHKFDQDSSYSYIFHKRNISFQTK